MHSTCQISVQELLILLVHIASQGLWFYIPKTIYQVLEYIVFRYVRQNL